MKTEKIEELYKELSKISLTDLDEKEVTIFDYCISTITQSLVTNPEQKEWQFETAAFSLKVNIVDEKIDVQFKRINL